ncbi:cytochrome aa3 quinol oxidase subunit III [Virgibacillus profundi]|uniref:Cytochrome aa3 quinol oxidase subunit III n=1 Tax=Virgibacillus profundi TaxID=2024555 RepID=A0A2A2IJ52_9BACI|nr:cytochrome c oxidase subunit 3 [Virgibacillus profundi]PAV31418.1 cytochrome aa3 quinol oxidase subunit III [Virgibacillus profundi]PXY55604.1 cytochrome aa3 quinol oxidase subunit III [Virgibacillus profundi]
MNDYESALFKDKQIGFLIYLGAEAIMFTVLFATYLIFTPAEQGPHPTEVFKAVSVILSSFFLLSSSGTLIAAEKGLAKNNQRKFITWFAITLLFAMIFLGLEIHEFYTFVSDGYGISVNVFMSSFYVLVGLHAAHVAFGIGWMIVLFIHYMRKIPMSLFREKHKIFSYYWHFVDVIWVVIILLVYLPYLL